MSFLSSNQIRNLARAVNPTQTASIEPVEPVETGPSPFSIRDLLQEKPAREPDFPQQVANDCDDEIVAKKIAKTGAETNAKIVAEPVTESVTKLAAEPVAQPVIEPIAEPVTKTVIKTVAKAFAEPVTKTDADDRGQHSVKLLGDDYGRDVANRLFASMHNANKARVVRVEAMRKGFVASKKEWTMRSVTYAQLTEGISVVRREAAQNLLDGAAYYKDYFQGQLDYLYANPIDHSQGRRTALDYAAKMLGKSRDDVREMFADYVRRQR